MKPTKEQLLIITEALEGHWAKRHGRAEHAWRVISEMVLEAAAKEVEALSPDHDPPNCAMAIRALKGTP
ncbi:MAG: hypothetical protein LC640_09015 [Frankia sp.]|nr:hypothetical protein [Frankia sp.]